MAYQAAIDPPLGLIEQGQSALEYEQSTLLVCGACLESMDPQQPALYEYLLHGTIGTVRIPAGEFVELPSRAWPVDGFHIECYETLVASLALNDGVHYFGNCPNSNREISSPRPLSRCPECAAEIQMSRAQQRMKEQ